MKVLNFADYVPEQLAHFTNPIEKEQKSDFIYSLACQYNLKDKAVRELCAMAEIDYPPTKLEKV